MKLKVKRLSKTAILPCKAHESDAGFDFFVDSVTESDPIDGILTYGTGIAVEIPEGYVGLLFPRSSVYKYDLELSNSVGVIDSGYRGEIKAKFRYPYSLNGADAYNVYEVGDKFLQMVLFKLDEFKVVEVNELSDSDRGSTGFGDSGK